MFVCIYVLFFLLLALAVEQLATFSRTCNFIILILQSHTTKTHPLRTLWYASLLSCVFMFVFMLSQWHLHEERVWLGGNRELVEVAWRGLRFLSLAANPSRLSLPLWGLTGSTEKNKALQQSPLSTAITHPPAGSELCVTFSRASSPTSTP